MNQICLKLVEQCLALSKYCTDINYFLELWVGGKRDKLILSYAFGSVGKLFFIYSFCKMLHSFI